MALCSSLNRRPGISLLSDKVFVAAPIEIPWFRTDFASRTPLWAQLNMHEIASLDWRNRS
jgi:hypothetical protein